MREGRPQSRRRATSGWVFALAGQGSAAGGMFLPVEMAVTAELAVVGGGLLLVLLYCLTARSGAQKPV